jgi:HEAT repeat protein
MNRGRIILSILVGIVFTTLGVLIVVFKTSHDPLFRGLPESQWIAGLKYNDDEQVEMWRGFGDEGVAVLARAYYRAQRPLASAYRRTYIEGSPRLPDLIVNRLPQPKNDETRQVRIRIISLLTNLGIESLSPLPAVVDALKDEDESVRGSAATFFSAGESEDAPITRIDPTLKAELLPLFVAALSMRDGPFRNNCAVVLRYYPEAGEELAPALLSTMVTSKENHTRMVAATALRFVAPDRAREADVVGKVIEILNDPDDQKSYRAAEWLGKVAGSSELSVPALIEAATSESPLTASRATRALGRFSEWRETTIPVFENLAATRTGWVKRHSEEALKRLEPSSE